MSIKRAEILRLQKRVNQLKKKYQANEVDYEYHRYRRNYFKKQLDSAEYQLDCLVQGQMTLKLKYEKKEDSCLQK
jgi:hypothetical protein